MNWPHIHLILNHFPVIGLVLIILLCGVAMLRKSDELQRITLAAFVFIALTAVPVYLTGEAASETVEKLPGVIKGMVEAHEEVASLALVLNLALGAVALSGLIFFRHSTKIPPWFMGFLLAAALAVSAVTGLTANFGGMIRHPEIREGASATGPSAGTDTGGHRGKPGEEDDSAEA